MKNKMLFLSVFATISVSVMYSTLVTKVYFKEVKIESDLLQIIGKLTDMKKVAQWYLPFATGDTSKNVFIGGQLQKLTNSENSIGVERELPGSVWYKINSGGKSRSVVYSVFADSARLCRVRVNYESTLWNNLFGGDEITANAKKSLLNLKEYFTDTKKMYGYEIEMTQLQDTTFLFLSNVVPNSKKREGIKNLFDSLIGYAKDKNAGYTGNRIFYYNSADKDSTHLFGGIGILNAPSFADQKASAIELKRMPYKTKLLVAYYQDAFKNLKNAYEKMEEYTREHNMTVVALPFTKFLTDGYNFADDQVIQAVVCYPIF
jgi:hypothetical protein